MIQRIFGNRMLISRADINETRRDDAGEAPKLEDDQALFAVDRVALTANNVTYAAMGEKMGYWRFFPAPDGNGILPVWGFATCTASKAKGIDKGDRFYGYWPLAEQLLVETDQVGARGFTDPSEHRQGLAAPYNRYNRRDEDGDPAEENLEAIFRPLFATGWLLARAMATASDYGAKQVIISSASSKTAMSAAWTFAGRDADQERPRITGLTSPANVDFTRSLGVYDSVLAYDDLEGAPADESTVYLDFAGDLALRRRVHRHFGGHLGRSIAIGLTHWEETGGDITGGGSASGGDMPGPEAKLFFAPDAIADQQQTLGHAEFVRQNEAAWSAFADWARPHIETRTLTSLAEAETAYRDLAAGRIGGAAGIIVTLDGGG